MGRTDDSYRNPKSTTYTSITNIMKKTYNINLNGQVFCIDDDACLKLQSYIDTLESHYLKEEDGREIMADIESRIAELLKEALGKGYKQVVTMEDIDQIIRIMCASGAQ